MQARHEDVVTLPNGKKFGHQRRPSIGKSVPVTSFVLSLPTPASLSKNYCSLSRDGLSPDLDKPPIFFHVDQENESAIANDSSTKNHDEPSPPLQVLQLSPTKSSSSATKEKVHTISVEGNDADATRYRKIPVISTNDCSNCPSDESSSDVLSVNDSCSKFCKTDPCEDLYRRKDLEDIVTGKMTKSSLKIPSKIDQKRKEFLNDLLNADNDGNEKELIAEKFTMKDFREKFAIAEALAKTSMMTSPAAKRRLVARRIEMELDGEYGGVGAGDGGLTAITAGASDDEKEFIPPRQLLLYLVRMGSFNSAPKINNPDSQDDSLEIPHGLSPIDLLQFCNMMRGENRPQLLTRYFLKPITDKALISSDITDGLRVLKLNAVSKTCSAPICSPNQLRVFQWNVLSQCLGQNNDGFIKCPEEALTWEYRKYLIAEEIVRNNPDVICLQEVDHFKFLERILGSQSYNGIFYPKPDSPCLYIQENNGPDGCAIFYKRDKFELINFDTRILEVWRVQSNQVAIVANLRVIETGKEIAVCTTHLKARNGALLSKLRNEQGKDLLRFVSSVSQGRPVILSGDFNAEPIEPIYNTILNCKAIGLSSAYSDLYKTETPNVEKVCNGCTTNENTESVTDQETGLAELSANCEPRYTTWKIREEGEVCHTIDYIFYSKKFFKVNNCLQFPNEVEIGVNRTPSLQYPSDHFSLVCDLELVDDPKDLIV